MTYLSVKNNYHAFTLLELLFSLAIASILLFIALPNLQKCLQREQLSTYSHRMIAAIRDTQAQALTQNQTIAFCGSQNHKTCDGQWDKGQIIIAANTNQPLQIFSPLHNYDLSWQSTLGKNQALEFEADGFTTQEGRFIICSHSRDGLCTAIIVSRSGRARIEK